MNLRKKRLAVLVATAALSIALLAPAMASADWGAIAVNIKTGKTGISYNYNSSGGAKKRARNECGKGCRVAVFVRNGYAALVVKPKTGVFAAGYGRTKAIAFRLARHRAHDGSARAVTSVFSGY